MRDALKRGSRKRNSRAGLLDWIGSVREELSVFVWIAGRMHEEV